MAKHSFYSIFTLLFLLGATGIQAQTFLEASLSTPANAGILSESCGGPYALIIERGDANIETTDIFISDIGAAQIGVDYTFPDGTFPLQMLPTDTVVVIPITVINDGSPEGFETLSWEIAYLAGLESGIVTVETGITDSYDVEILTSADTIQWCRYAPLQLTASSTAEINWSPTFSFDNSTGAEVTVRPFLSGWYFATVGTDTCGAKDSVYLDLAIADILGPDTFFICLEGEGAKLQGRLEGLATTFMWIPSDSTLSDPILLNPTATPTVTTTYILQSDFGVCIAADTVVVKVDSLPGDMHIDIAPLKAYYCAGEVVALFSPAFDSLDFPDIIFNWTPDNGTFESPKDVLNAALTLQDTTLYIRENFNNACASKDSILINVVPPAVPLSVTDTILCPGEMFTVTVLSDQVTEPEWTPDEGLSCNMCLNPTITVIGTPGTTVIYMFSGKILECPVGAVLPIQIPPIQIIDIITEAVVCVGDMVPLTITNPAGLSNFNWSVVSGNGTLSCTSCPDPIVTINSAGSVGILLTANTTNANFCGAQGSILISTSNQLQQIDISGDNVVCQEDVVPLSITDLTGLSGFTWSIIEGDATLSCTNCPDPAVTITGSDTVLVRLTANTTNPDFCSAGGVFELIPGSQPQLNGTEFFACLDGTVVVNTGDLSLSNPEWSVVSGDLNLSCTNCVTPTVTVNSAGSLRFFAESTDPDICKVSGLVAVKIFGGDVSNLIREPMGDSILQGSEVIVTLFATPEPSPITWTVNGQIVSGSATSIVFNAEEEINFVVATFINSLGCEQTDTLSFTTIPPSFMIPNAFTPDNGDDFNDNFRIIITGNIVIEKFMIFNRWGQLVYEAPTDDLGGWDGMWKNEPAASDTYVYTATLRYPDGRSEVRKGDVTLLR
ncbi:MAG: gliding motility-associated C-terminal domain-containing protein [Saprospiraceae bacterium]|nr:gliding motility-associated C-terminal domain-containing protein [Saprospiraceae bacterium]